MVKNKKIKLEEKEEAYWFVIALVLVLLGIGINKLFFILVCYGLFLGLLGHRPKYFIFGSELQSAPIASVLDSTTAEPIPLAIVRIYNHETQRLVLTKVTNYAGCFDCLIPPGTYSLEVTKEGYQFPSSGKKGYKGEYIQVEKTTQYYLFRKKIFLDKIPKIQENNTQAVFTQVQKTKLESI
ncbi:MAG: hypothetical protein G01um101418_446 [Parcubacteria group bacterium Gr01-1014_18]|nr:MAG: hypothetical protein Greene041636_491 [Parcubacteria group bacterium Greene0416_36]TSC81033.1 MAG: hypothetical protein G01um101418_446 [Parcubacteria group bacterium Gr01-1014_18]TSC98955.1 MAG: hypothetical protein Greene101420_467 [Parcubacteria group bacterium Greene1014_20]TSD06753.1 MAG: hypothetical protein Greene07142_674 [Parcubacteria group bacterium Greene0714_2]